MKNSSAINLASKQLRSLAWVLVLLWSLSAGVFAQDQQPPQNFAQPPERTGAESTSTEGTVDTSVFASQNQFLVVLLTVAVLALYTSVRLSKTEQHMENLESAFNSTKKGLGGATYECLQWDDLFRSIEEGLPVLPDFCLDRPRLLLLGCPGNSLIPKLSEFSRNSRLNLLLNSAYEVLSEPTQKLLVFSSRLGVRQIGWGLLSLAGQTNFNDLSKAERAELLSSLDIADWENRLYNFAGSNTTINELYRISNKLAEDGSDLTLVLDGWDFLLTNYDRADKASGDSQLAIWQKLGQDLSVLAKRGHLGIILLLDTADEAWRQRLFWAANWAEISISEDGRKWKAEGQLTDYNGNLQKIEAQWDCNPESGALGR
ncbi:MAG: hypothetical protein ACI376_08955 [Candidatus Bruticola sp.]